MNSLERKTFYLFLGLYLASSLLFIALMGYWYYTAQKNALENETYYKLQHLTDMKANEILIAHMEGRKLERSFVPDGIKLALIDAKGMVTEGRLVEPFMNRKAGYFKSGGYSIFISDAPQKHLNIAFVVAQSNSLHHDLEELKEMVLKVMFFATICMAVIAMLLSKVFVMNRIVR